MRNEFLTGVVILMVLRPAESDPKTTLKVKRVRTLLKGVPVTKYTFAYNVNAKEGRSLTIAVLPLECFHSSGGREPSG